MMVTLIFFSPIGTTRIQLPYRCSSWNFDYSQWRRNINLSWMKAIARSKKNPKAGHEVPIAPHTRVLESVSRGGNLNCCVCLKSMSPSQTLGLMTASDSFSHRCSDSPKLLF
ncbi:unnamed protein product [Prunus brigantina]